MSWKDCKWVEDFDAQHVLGSDGNLYAWAICATPGCTNRVNLGKSDKYCFPCSGSGQTFPDMDLAFMERAFAELNRVMRLRPICPMTEENFCATFREILQEPARAARAAARTDQEWAELRKRIKDGAWRPEQ